MLTNEREKRICEKYSKRDSDGYVHCNDCPLRKSFLRCKSNSHYDRKTKMWELDELETTERSWFSECFKELIEAPERDPDMYEKVVEYYRLGHLRNGR